ncbi:MAG: protein kinase [Anaerolineales bacterium]
MEPGDELALQTTLAGRYQILSRLGAGGMAHVYKAQDTHLQRQVGIKLLRAGYMGDPAFRQRFLQEARSAANLIHPNIVTLYDFVDDGQRVFMVMEYVEGTDLKSLLRRQGILPVREAVDLMVQTCAGVGYAHRAGLIHCDLKPHNILISGDGRAKITDFGIARALSTLQREERQEVVWGSPQYFSPEQAAGSPPSPASDVYALGVVLFEMLTGRLPFESDDPDELSRLHLSALPPSPRTLNPALPPALEQMVLKVLAKEPSARYRSADQLGRVLAGFAVEAAPEATPAPRAPVGPATPDRATAPFLAAAEDQVDWLAIALGLAAFLAVGGLVPLWLSVCLLYPSCPLR